MLSNHKAEAVRPEAMLFLNNKSRIIGKVSRLPILEKDAIILQLNEQTDPRLLQQLGNALAQKWPRNTIIVLPHSATIASVPHDSLIAKLQEAKKNAEPQKRSLFGRRGLKTKA